MIVNMVVDRKENKTGNVAITLDDKTKFIINYSVDKKGVHIVYNGNKKLLTKDDINVLEDFIWDRAYYSDEELEKQEMDLFIEELHGKMRAEGLYDRPTNEKVVEVKRIEKVFM